MSEERWLPVVGYEGLYEVSDLGRVRSVDRICHDTIGRHRRLRGRTIAIHPNVQGYAFVPLWRDNQKKMPMVHHLVLAAFVGPRPKGMDVVVRHLNGNRMDPRLENLTYGTMQENALDRVDHGTDVNARKTHCKRGHEFTAENIYENSGRRHCRPCRNREQQIRRGRAA